MTKNDRKIVMREVKKRISIDIPNFKDVRKRKQDKLQDEYISDVCNEDGFILKEFYDTNDDELKILLNIN